MDNEQIRAAGRVAGKAAGRLAGKAARNAGKEWMPAVRNSGKFVKHVVPAAVKPLHTLWHEVLGFVFLSFAAMAGFRMWREISSSVVPYSFFVCIQTINAEILPCQARAASWCDLGFILLAGDTIGGIPEPLPLREE